MAYEESYDGARSKTVKAIQQVVESSSGEEWKALSNAIVSAAQEFQEFTTDQVWPFVKIGIREPRLMGPIIIQAKADGVIENKTCPTCKSEQFQESERETAHSVPKRVYVSLIHRRIKDDPGANGSPETVIQDETPAGLYLE